MCVDLRSAKAEIAESVAELRAWMKRYTDKPLYFDDGTIVPDDITNRCLCGINVERAVWDAGGDAEYEGTYYFLTCEPTPR